MKVLVCGGRDFNDYEFVAIALDRIHAETPITNIIHGGATGADYQASCWAGIHDVKTTPFPAQWSKHGKAAGPIRNLQMLTEGNPDLVVAFPGGRGTANMVDQARLAGVQVDVADRDPAKAVDALRASVQRTTSRQTGLK